jgi:phage shock protein PspC (stress-responsive transcriptional regulator)
MASTPPASDTDEAPGAPEADDATTAPPAPEGRPEPRFFRWIRSLGLVRRTGWLGGVCAAIAERTRLDPILVRGVVVVLAVLGAPVVLVYAAAWLLLPDEKGAIHALTLARGRVEGAVVAIAALALASFLPLTQGFWWAGAAYWGEPDFGASAGRILWTALVIAVAIVVVVWLARRAANPDIRTVPATTDDRPETVPGPADAVALAATAADATAATVTTDATVPPAEAAAPEVPPAPPPGASDAELAAWTAQQEEWKRQRAAWAAQQRADDRARRAAAHAAWAQERDARLAERQRRDPFVGIAVIGVVLGLALVAGCLAGLAATLAAPGRAIGWAAGLAVAAAVFGIALAIAGLARRRAGALAALAIVALAGAVATTPLATDRTILPWAGGYGLDTTHSGSYARLGGSTEMYVWKEAHRAPGTTVDLWQRTGSLTITADKGMVVRVIAVVSHGSVRPETIDAVSRARTPGDPYAPTSTADGADRYDVTYGGSGTPDLTVRAEMLNGSILIGTEPGPPPAKPKAKPAPGATASPTATPTPRTTEGAQP